MMPAAKKKTSKKSPHESVAVTSHGTDHGHESRVDEMSEYDATHQLEPAQWIRPSSLEAPKPRKGMTQRWVRISLRGVDDPKNLNRAWREGWRPRDPATLPEDWRVFANHADQNEGRIVVDDLLLMEIDSGVLARKKAAVQAATAAQMRGVEHDLESSQIAGHPIVKEHTTSVSYPKGQRPAMVADDE